MKISKDNFFSIGSDLQIPKDKMEVFWNRIEKSEETRSTPFAKALYYFGALVVIAAMTWFMNVSWELFGGGGIFLISVAYATLFTIACSLLWNKKGLRIPAGLFMTLAVCMTPLAIYGLEAYFNIFKEPYTEYYFTIDPNWIFMELGTIVAGLVALWFFPFPFLTVPIFFSAWFLSMDIVPLINQKYWVTLFLGLVLMALGFVLDKKKKEDFAFWSYLFGALSFWCGLGSLVWDKSEFVLFLYLLINLILMVLSILLRRNVLMIFGALGVFAYLAHLAYDLFKDSLVFPFVLSVFGVALIYLGILYQKNSQTIERKIFSKLPKKFRDRF